MGGSAALILCECRAQSHPDHVGNALERRRRSLTDLEPRTSLRLLADPSRAHLDQVGGRRRGLPLCSPPHRQNALTCALFKAEAVRARKRRCVVGRLIIRCHFRLSRSGYAAAKHGVKKPLGERGAQGSRNAIERTSWAVDGSPSEGTSRGSPDGLIWQQRTRSAGASTIVARPHFSFGHWPPTPEVVACPPRQLRRLWPTIACVRSYTKIGMDHSVQEHRHALPNLQQR